MTPTPTRPEPTTPTREDELLTAARQAATALYNIAQFNRPLTDRERQSCRDVREALDNALKQRLTSEPAGRAVECAREVAADYEAAANAARAKGDMAEYNLLMAMETGAGAVQHRLVLSQDNEPEPAASVPGARGAVVEEIAGYKLPWVADRSGGHVRVTDAEGKSIAMADFGTKNDALWSGIVALIGAKQP